MHIDVVLLQKRRLHLNGVSNNGAEISNLQEVVNIHVLFLCLYDCFYVLDLMNEALNLDLCALELTTQMLAELVHALGEFLTSILFLEKSRQILAVFF